MTRRSGVRAWATKFCNDSFSEYRVYQGFSEEEVRERADKEEDELGVVLKVLEVEITELPKGKRGKRKCDA